MTRVAFGIQGSGPLVGGAPDPGHFARVARAAEAAGFDSLWAGDHVSFHASLLEQTVALSVFATVTERISLGAGVLILPLRSPALVARAFASLDYLSGGRTILGVGIGGEHPRDFEAVGVPLRQRGARTDEAMRALRALFGSPSASFAGRFFAFEGISINPRPVQPGGPPLWVGGRSDAAIRRAATLGDAWIPLWVSPERYARGLVALREQAGGREVAAAVVLPSRIGGVVEDARAYLSQRYATEFAAHTVERYCLTGPPAQCAERVAEYIEAGARHIVMHPAVEPAGLEAQIELTAEVTRVWGRSVLPLADVRVIALEQFGAGPWGTLQLADLGAEVIKIEDPASGGDVGRYVPPFAEGEDSLFFEAFNRNKKSVSLDLRRDGAREVLHDLVRASDVVYSNLRGDQPRKLGITYEQLKDVNARIVCCSLSGFGMTGPRAAEGGYDYMMQGLAGWQSLTGDPDGPPTKSGPSLADYSGGYVSAIAVVAGLWRAHREGVGCDCDVSLFETSLHLLSYVGVWAASRGYVPPRRRNSAHPSIVPFQNFATADGWIVVACPKEKFWVLLCDALGRPELATDERFADFAARDRNRDELLPILDAVLAQRSSAEWLSVLAAAGVPSAPVNDVAAAFEDPQTLARGAVVEAEHPTLGTVRQVASPLRLGDETPLRRAPFRGEHTEAVLGEVCGYSRARIDELAAAGVFGS